MRVFPTEMVREAAPLSRLSDERALEYQESLAGREFEVRLGLTENHASAIGIIAQQASIRKFWPEDMTEERFGSVESSREWLARDGGKAFFVLLKSLERFGRRVVGYGWTTPGTVPEVPEAQTIFEIRIANEGRRQRLGVAFASLMIAATRQEYQAHDFCVKSWISNLNMFELYDLTGFVIKHEDGLAMIKEGRRKPRADGRVHMWLP